MDVGGVIIKHCPTDKICGGFFTNPLQGSKFRRFRLVILGNSRLDKPLFPRIVFDPKVDSNIIKSGGGSTHTSLEYKSTGKRRDNTRIFQEPLGID